VKSQSLDELAAERDALKDQVQELTDTKDWLYERWQASKNDLDLIHRSKMWKMWMASIAARRLLTAPFRLLFKLPSIFGSFLLLLARGAGFCHLKVMSRLRSARAWLRRRRTLPAAPSTLSTSLTSAVVSRPRLLLVSPYHIYPPNHGGGVRLINLVKRLSESCDLFLLVFSSRGEDAEQRKALEPYAVRVDFHRWVPAHHPDLFGLKPPNAQLFSSDRVTELIRDIVLGNQIDIVQLEYSELGQYASAVPDGVPVILTAHDIAFRTQQRRRQLRFMDRFPDSTAYCKTRTDIDRIFLHELKVCSEVDRIHVMSDVDGDFLASFLPDGRERIRVAPNGVDCANLAAPVDNPERVGVLYVGNFQNLPNVDALEYLVTDVWPLLRLRHPDATLTVVGAHPADRVTRFDGENGINVVGEVGEIRSYYHSHRVLAAPIRAGSGTRLKILEAFAAGIPVVSTTLGAEGIVYENNKHLLIADSALEFARALERLLEDPQEADRLARNGRQLAEQRYDWSQVSDVVLADYLELLNRSRKPGESGPTAGRAPVRWTPSDAGGKAQTRARAESPSRPPVISIIMPTFNGGQKLEETLDSIAGQEIDEAFELICVDSGSPDSELAEMASRNAQVWSIEGHEFNHGLTRDLGAKLSRGRILVFLNQDAVPAHKRWLDELTEPLRRSDELVAAVQGGIRDTEELDQRFFWDSCGERFYFTSESKQWIEKYHGIGFSTVNCAIRRSLWERIPFGWAPTMEDKKWQRRIVEEGFSIQHVENADVIHTHNYDLSSLVKRCSSEGFGWRMLGEEYTLGDMLGDLWRPRAVIDLLRERKERPLRSAAEVFFPAIRPLSVYWGNHFSSGG